MHRPNAYFARCCHSLKAAKASLQEARDAFLNKKGSNKSEMAKIVERQKEVEAEVEANDDKVKKYAKKLDEVNESYEEKQDELETLEEEAKRLYAQTKEQENLIRELGSQGGAGNLAVFGSKAPQLVQRVNKCKEKGGFRGNVYGPVGALLKMKAGNEKWAKLAEVAIQPQALQTFICDNEEDMKTLRRLRKETQCRTYELPLVYMNSGARYNVRGLNVQGVEVSVQPCRYVHSEPKNAASSLSWF